MIVGAMGVGKTTVGRLLACELGLAFHDSDVVLEARSGETGAGIAESQGVDQLHELELEVFLSACEESERSVISPAASVIDHEAGRAALERNTTIWLTASEDVLETRTAEGDHRRELGSGERERLRLRRRPWFEEVSDLTVDTGSTSPREVVAIILERLAD